MSITPRAIQDLLDELEASKQSRLRAWNALQLLRSVLAEVANVGHSGSGSEDLQRGRRDPGTCFDQILPPPEQSDQKSVFLSPPIQGRNHQGRMQKRLSARSSGALESSRSGRGSDSGLNPVTPEIKTEMPSLILRLLRE
jgi:hypothetical protein